MPIKGGLYARGEYYLDYIKGKGGKLASSKLYICWYCKNAGRIRRKSAGTSDVRLASEALDLHFLEATKPSSPAAVEVYTVSKAMTDYWLTTGSKRVSSDAIRARLKLLSRFLDHEVESGRMRDPILPMDLDDDVIDRFRSWGVEDPILTRKRGLSGEWTVSSRSRAASTVEESVIQLKAALNYAAVKGRAAVPQLKHLTRDEVTAPRSYRLSIEMLAKMLDYTATGAGKYAGHADRLVPLRRYLIGAISTLARPDAIMDMSVQSDRSQWYADAMVFDLNPAGRIQTRKRRSVLPIPPMLDHWLRATDGKLVCREVTRRDSDGREWIEQIPVTSVKKAWSAMAQDLGIPTGWGPKLIRYSVATIITKNRVDLFELEMALGHRVLKRTTSIYAIFDPDYLSTVRSCITSLWEELERLCEHPLHATLTQVGEDGRRRRL
ncbi:hypothetical protein [Sphingobium herbicidovorans]